MEDERKESAGVPPPDSLELTPLLLLLPLLRSAIGDVDDSSKPRLSIEASGEEPTSGGLPALDGEEAADMLPTSASTPPPPGNQLGKLLFNVSIRS